MNQQPVGGFRGRVSASLQLQSFRVKMLTKSKHMPAKTKPMIFSDSLSSSKPSIRRGQITRNFPTKIEDSADN